MCVVSVYVCVGVCMCFFIEKSKNALSYVIPGSPGLVVVMATRVV